MSRELRSSQVGSGQHPSLGVCLDFEVIDPAERRAQLVLDPALDTEDVYFESMRCVGDVARRAVLQAQGRQSAEQSNCNRRRRTGAATSRDTGTHTNFHGEAPWGWEGVDGGLQQRVAGDPGRPRDDGVPVAESLNVEHHKVRAFRRADRNLHSRRHGDIQDPSRPPKPGVGPPTDVADPDGSRYFDHRSALSAAGHGRMRSSSGMVRVTMKPAQTGAMCCPVATPTPSARFLIEWHVNEGVALLAHCPLSTCRRAIAMASASLCPPTCV